MTMISMYKNKMNNGRIQMIVTDLETEQMIGQAFIKDKQLVGQFFSDMFTFMDGHMYFNNSVVKFRYDLIKSSRDRFMPSKEFFNTYNNLIELKSGEAVYAKQPLMSSGG